MRPLFGGISPRPDDRALLTSQWLRLGGRVQCPSVPRPSLLHVTGQTFGQNPQKAYLHASDYCIQMVSRNSSVVRCSSAVYFRFDLSDGLLSLLHLLFYRLYTQHQLPPRVYGFSIQSVCSFLLSKFGTRVAANFCCVKLYAITDKRKPQASSQDLLYSWNQPRLSSCIRRGDDI